MAVPSAQSGRGRTIWQELFGRFGRSRHAMPSHGTGRTVAGFPTDQKVRGSNPFGRTTLTRGYAAGSTTSRPVVVAMWSHAARPAPQRAPQRAPQPPHREPIRDRPPPRDPVHLGQPVAEHPSRTLPALLSPRCTAACWTTGSTLSFRCCPATVTRVDLDPTSTADDRPLGELVPGDPAATRWS